MSPKGRCPSAGSSVSRGLIQIIYVPTTFSAHQQAILTFEDDQLDRALENLKRAQRVCYVENARKGAALGLDEMLMRQILYADCELYMALLTFLKQGTVLVISVYYYYM